MKPSLLSFSIDDIKKVLIDLNEKPFHANQIYKSLHLGLTFDEMTDLSKDLRIKLDNLYLSQSVKIIQTLKSKIDKTEKYLFYLQDGNVIEGVFMNNNYGNTICISTQVGCRMNCAFCASGLNGLIRNLTPDEMLGEIICVNKLQGGLLGEKRKISNVVLMGSGEPLDNYENVVKFLRLLSDKNGINISLRNVSLSTSGLVDKMYNLADENLQLSLTVSLHNPFDEERQKIMPVAKSNKISDIIKACENFLKKTGRKYYFEYVIIKDVNDSFRHADELIKLLKGKNCNVNLIRLNDVKEKGLTKTSSHYVYAFCDYLVKNGLNATVRHSFGSDINGACGQLRQKYIENLKEKL